MEATPIIAFLMIIKVLNEDLLGIFGFFARMFCLLYFNSVSIFDLKIYHCSSVYYLVWKF